MGSPDDTTVERRPIERLSLTDQVRNILLEDLTSGRLRPGDLVLTGSPAGNGQHWKRFLQDGDVMTGSISGLGTQEVRCVAEGIGA